MAPFRTRTATVAAILAASLAILLCASGCSQADQAVSARPLLAEADFDGDGRAETASLGVGPGGVILVDEDVIYRTRSKWSVARAAIGDLDRDGLPEVVAFFDKGADRHLALVAWFGGSYRERLVSQPLVPRPEAFALKPGELIELRYPDKTSELFCWNGFGFVSVEELQ